MLPTSPPSSDDILCYAKGARNWRKMWKLALKLLSLFVALCLSIYLGKWLIISVRAYLAHQEFVACSVYEAQSAEPSIRINVESKPSPGRFSVHQLPGTYYVPPSWLKFCSDQYIASELGTKIIGRNVPFPRPVGETDLIFTKGAPATGEELFGTAFLHARTTPSGSQLLVAIDVLLDENPKGSWYLWFYCRTLRQRGAFQAPELVYADLAGPRILFSPSAQVEMWEGIPSSTSASEFSIKIRVNDWMDNLDGAIQNDGSLRLVTRVHSIPWFDFIDLRDTEIQR